ncbi:Thioredoxin-like fold protein [Metarhizium guizhouense ARSEF 977]|uniref:Thioredoxin-like fold protein n=1 Tax=Metarhizium guizhouense (strain ARSEF 977) TaxID=1276136 RepID=A0A0B4HHG9_METGA|nr:Thioredoxin-like fold protein [Metarhizium guizhouense ARSEF 977]
MAQASTKVQTLIDENPVVVFSKSYCPYCRSTKETLKKLGAEFKALELDQIPDGAALQDALEDITGQRTVPNVHIRQKHIGGNSDVQSLNNSGKLEGLLKDSGALKA